MELPEPIDGPLLIFGGPYGNLQALLALFAEARSLGIPPARMICTGDLAAYAADPQPVADRLRDAGVAVVMGNVEEALADDAADCRCGFEKGSLCDALAAAWYRHADAALDADTKRWMGTLPRRIDFTLANRRFAVVHGGVRSINRFIFPSTPAEEKRAELARAGADAVIGGHSGLPFTERLGRSLWHNAGAIGLPANDGTPRVWYGMLWPSAQGIAIAIRALSYDHDAAAARIRAVGLPEAYARTLETGLWPSDEMMPAADRARRGRTIAPGETLWRRLQTADNAAA